MSVYTGAFDRSLKAFGLAWHGLHVITMSGENYIELANGRRIELSPRAESRQEREFYATNENTALVDNRVSVSPIELEDPDAEIWPVAIASGTDLMSAWPGAARSRVQLRKNRSTGAFHALRAAPDMNIDLSTGRLSVNLQDGRGTVYIGRGEHRIPDGEISGSRFFSRLDVSSDGRNWLLACFSGFVRSHLAINLSGAQLLALVEARYSSDFSTAEVEVVANYDDCNPQSEEGRGDKLTDMAIVRAPDSPPAFVTYTDNIWSQYPPDTRISRYEVGSSSAEWTCDFIVGAWYAGDAIKFVKLRAESTYSLDLDNPVQTEAVPGSGPFFRSPRTWSIVQRFSLGTDGNFSESITVDYRLNSGANSVTEIVSVNGIHAASASHTYKPAAEDQLIFPYERATAPARTTPEWLLAVSGWLSTSLTVNVALLSNKVISCLCEAVDHIEHSARYYAGPALTPGGAHAGTVSTDNVWPGMSSLEPGYDPVLHEKLRLFRRGSYNPVTQQVVRNRMNGDRYGWV